jgi:hypothetical protein
VLTTEQEENELYESENMMRRGTCEQARKGSVELQHVTPRGCDACLLSGRDAIVPRDATLHFFRSTVMQ